MFGEDVLNICRSESKRPSCRGRVQRLQQEVVLMKVLIVSSDRALLRHVSRFLATFGYETTQVADYQRAVQIADSISADLLLVDSSPDFDGALELCRAVSERGDSGGHYVLLMVDAKSQSRLLDAVEAGADDCVSKPVVYGEVLMRLRAGARAVEFQRRRHRQRRREPITGLLTCAAFHARLQAAGASRASRSGRLACAMIEIDFVDHVVRELGQRAEHELLREVGGLLDQLCGNDRAEVAHFGNGEFCVLLPGATSDEAIRWGEQVRSEIAGREFGEGDQKTSLTVSVGIGGAETLTMSPEAILDKSRQALETARASGRNCVVQVNQFAEEELAWKELAAPGRLFEHTVARDVMLPCTIVLNVNDTLRSVESLFQQTHLTSMSVVDRNDQFVGSVFAEDVAEYMQALGDPDQPITRIMVQKVDVVDEDAPFVDLMRLFAESDIDLVVVVEDKRPTGIVSAASLASLSQVPEHPAFCTETPCMGSSYLHVVEPLEMQPTTDTV